MSTLTTNDFMKMGFAQACMKAADISYELEQSRAEIEALKQQVEQGKREAVPEGLIESVARAIYMQWRDADGYLHWQAGGNSLMQDSARRIAATAIAAAPKGK